MHVSDPPSPDPRDGFTAAVACIEYIQERAVVGDVEKYGPGRGGEFEGAFAFQSLAYIPARYIKGHLIESWEVSLDKIVWHVRPGIYWAPTEHQSAWMEARELTADDMVADMHEYIEGPWGGRFVGYVKGGVSGVYATDRYRLVIELEKYSPVVQYYFAWEDRPIIAAPEMIVAGAGSWENQVGTGPFMFDEYIIGSHFSFTRNPNYWDTTVINGVEYQLPFVDQVLLPIIPDLSTRLAALATGVIETLGVAPQYFDMLDNAAPEMEMSSYLGGPVGLPILRYRTDTPPFDDVKVRQACMIGTDLGRFQELNSAVGTPLLYFPIVPWAPSYVPLEEMPADVQQLFVYDPELAIEMLAEAGYSDGFKTAYRFPTELARYLDEASMLRDQWAKIGIEVELIALDATSFTHEMRSMTTPQGISWEGLLQGNLGDLDPVTGTIMNATTGGAYNYGNYYDPEFDELMDTISMTLDADAQDILLKEANLALVRACIYQPLGSIPDRTYWWPWLKNYYGELSLQDNGSFAAVVTYMWIDEDLKAEMGY
ncbi:hypothetical protein ES703_93554 [subsurface metagenome]